MNKPNRTAYSFSHRIKGETGLELFDKYYLQVRDRKFGRSRKFKLELAILNPEPVHVQNSALHWLAAACIAGLSALYILFLLISTPDFSNLLSTLAAFAAAILLSLIFTALFLFTSERKWVLKTRTALYPLVEIPYHKNDKEPALRFVKNLQTAIEHNIAEKGYTHETLFAGEMRMLRRLAKKRVLSIGTYDRAKKQMLEHGGRIGVAS
jgi:hypothetical protein